MNTKTRFSLSRILRYAICSGIILTMILSLFACRSDSDGDPETSGEKTTQEEEVSTAMTEKETDRAETSAEETETTDVTDTEETETSADAAEIPGEYIYPVRYAESQAGSKTGKILKVSDFGAVGDGKTDDGPAIDQAIEAVIEQSATLKFDPDKTYYIGTTSRSAGAFKTPFVIQNAHDVTIDGQNALFVISPELTYFLIADSENIRLENCRFTLRDSAYLVGKVIKVKKNTVTYEVDRKPNLKEYDFTAVNGFSIAYNKGIQGRPHRFLGKMTEVGDKTVEVCYKSSPDVKTGNLVYLPNPGIGHIGPEMAHIRACTGAVSLNHIQFHEARSFVTAIKSNEAEIYINDMDYVPDPDSNRQIQMVGWRDGYHCKDNRLPIHWDNCQVDVLFDDVFNIRSTLGYVTKVNGDTGLTVTNAEMHLLHGVDSDFDCQIGDVLDVFSHDDRYYGAVTVRSVRQNGDGTTSIGFAYGQSIPGMSEGMMVANRNTAAPGSTVAHSKFTGTYRFTRNMRISDCTFDNLIHWIMYEGGVEGPIAGNIDFINCTFTGGIIQIDALDRPANRFLKEIGKEIKDVGFFGCIFNKTKITTQSGCTYTVKDQWTKDDLFTGKEDLRREEPVVIHPSAQDIQNHVAYDYDHYTMDMTLTDGRLMPVQEIKDPDIRRVLLVNQDFSDTCLYLHGGRVLFKGLSADAFPGLHEQNSRYAIYLTFFVPDGGQNYAFGYMTEDGRTVELINDCFGKKGGIQSVIFPYVPTDADKVAGFFLTVEKDVYIGTLTVGFQSSNNPTMEDLEDGHLFDWQDGVAIGSDGNVENVRDIQDETVKEAILKSDGGFTTGHVWHTPRGLGVFTGMMDKSYYVPGRTYTMEFDAYVKTPISANATVYFISLDDTPGNRVLAQGLFTKPGLYHFKQTWTVSERGDNGLTFFIGGTPSQFPDIYFGDLTVKLHTSTKPESFVERQDVKDLTEEEARNGYTFDFSDHHAFHFNRLDAYTEKGMLPAAVQRSMKKADFGDRMFYFDTSVDLLSVNPILKEGMKLKITLHVFDNFGNLVHAEGRTPLLILPMNDQTQNGGEVCFTSEPSAVHPSVADLTFVVEIGAGTNNLRLYPLNVCNFYIDSVSVQVIGD